MIWILDTTFWLRYLKFSIVVPLVSLLPLSEEFCCFLKSKLDVWTWVTSYACLPACLLMKCAIFYLFLGLFSFGLSRGKHYCYYYYAFPWTAVYMPRIFQIKNNYVIARSLCPRVLCHSHITWNNLSWQSYLSITFRILFEQEILLLTPQLKPAGLKLQVPIPDSSQNPLVS